MQLPAAPVGFRIVRGNVMHWTEYTFYIWQPTQTVPEPARSAVLWEINIA